MWKIDAETGTRTLVPTLSLRQHTRKLRNKLNKIEPSISSHERRFSADLPLGGGSERTVRRGESRSWTGYIKSAFPEEPC